MTAVTDWITAVGTVGAAVGTVAAVVTSLHFSARDGRLRAERERSRQAEHVTAWIDGWDNTKFLIQLRNSSEQPVYWLIVSLVSVQGAFRRTAVGDSRTDAAQFRRLVGLVPPGSTTTTLGNKGGGMNLQFGLEVAFQDAAGRCWLREGEGTLKEVDAPPLRLYDIAEPVGWQRT